MKKLLALIVLVISLCVIQASWASQPYLARGTWNFTGTGTGTVAGSTERISAVISGVARVESTGEAGDEWITRFIEESTWKLSSTNGYSQTYSLREDIPMSYHNTDNTYTFSDSGLIWHCVILDENTATMTCKGTTYIEGYRATVNITYNAKRDGVPETPVPTPTPTPDVPGSSSGSSGGGGCTVGVFSPLMALLLVPVLLLRR